jgi:hypothetical protein
VLVPVGTYRAKALQWVLTEIGEKKTPAVAIEFAFVDPELGKITWDGWLSEKALERTVESLRHCGWEGSDVSELHGLDANEVELVIEHEEYEGNTYAKVRWVNRGGGLSHKTPLSGHAAKFFASQLKDKIKALDASKGATAPRTAPKSQSARRSAPTSSADPAGPPEPPPLSDDDIPW